MERQWFVYSEARGERGPFTEREVKLALFNGALSPDDYAFTEGMEDWEAIREIDCLCSVEVET